MTDEYALRQSVHRNPRMRIMGLAATSSLNDRGMSGSYHRHDSVVARFALVAAASAGDLSKVDLLNL